MPKFVSDPTYINDFAAIGAIQMAKKKVWYIRMYWSEGKTAHYKSLKIPYETGYASQKEAMKLGIAKYEEFKAKVSLGLSPSTTTEVAAITDEYFRHITDLAKKNEELEERGRQPKWEVKGGKGFHSSYRVNQIESILGYLRAYWQTLPSQDIASITFNQLEGFDDWMNEHYDLSPSRRSKCITQIRMIWRYARDKGYVNWLPNPSRPAQQIKERARRNLKEEEWEKMREWSLSQLNRIARDKYARAGQKDFAYQFFLWFQVISWTGIRPPNGAVKKNLMRWDSYKKIGNDAKSEKRLFERNGEKGHTYVATIHPRGWRYFDALEEFHKKRGTYKPDGYMFCHTHAKEGSFEVGDPINNFYKQWKKMLVELELDSPKGTPQNQKLVPYALRGYYITMRLRSGVNIDKLALACGTSRGQVLSTYYDFSSEREYDELNVGFELDTDAPDLKVDDSGFLIPNELDEAMEIL